MEAHSTNTTEELKRYAVSFYNHFAVEQQQIFVLAHNRMEAASIALMEIGKNATMDDIDSLSEVGDEYYITYEEAFNRYRNKYNQDPVFPDAKWDEKEQEWYYKEGSDGEKYYY